jgi:hypothetical protein
MHGIPAETASSEQTAPAEEPKAAKKPRAAAHRAHVAPSKAKSGKKASPAKKATKGRKSARSPKKAPGSRQGSKTAKVLDLVKALRRRHSERTHERHRLDCPRAQGDCGSEQEPPRASAYPYHSVPRVGGLGGRKTKAPHRGTDKEKPPRRNPGGQRSNFAPCPNICHHLPPSGDRIRLHRRSSAHVDSHKRLRNQNPI